MKQGNYEKINELGSLLIKKHNKLGLLGNHGIYLNFFYLETIVKTTMFFF